MEKKDSDQETSARRLVYFAAERTLMSWIRVALTLMALGFVIDRFDLVVKHMMSPAHAPVHGGFFYIWGGSILAIVGAAMAVVGGFRYLLFALRYHREESTQPGRGLYVGVFFSFLVAVMGVMIALYITTVAV